MMELLQVKPKFLLLFIAKLSLLASVVAFSDTRQPTCREVLSGGWKTPSHKTIDFDQYIDIQPDSYAAFFPDIYKELLEIYHRYPEFQSFFNGDIQTMTVSRLVLTYLHRMQMLAESIAKVAANLPMNDVRAIGFRQRLNEAVRYLGAYSASKSMTAKWHETLRAASWERFLQDRRLVRGLTREDGRIIFANMARLRSFWAELLIAARLPEWAGNNVHFEDLERVWPEAQISHLDGKDRQREIDILWRDGRDELHFGEMKVSRSALDWDSEEMDAILLQLKNMKYVAEASIPKRHGCSIFVHLFFFPSMSQRAKELLEEQGYIVHTVVDSAPDFLKSSK